MNSPTSFLHADVHLPDGFRSVSLPQHHATTVVFPDTRTLLQSDEFSEDGYYYGLIHTPTTLSLASKIAAIEGGTHAVLASSGMAALALVSLATLRAGDAVLLPKNAYRPNRNLAREVLSALGVRVHEYAPSEANIAALGRDDVALLWIEAPGSITLEIPDVAGLIADAHAAGARVAVDNTWSAGVYFRPLDLGADFSVQALSKYQGGGSDVFLGAVVTRDGDAHWRLKRTAAWLGYLAPAHDCALVYRSLGSLWVRLAAHEASALRLARTLCSHPKVARVLHPALPGCDSHERWKRWFTGSSGVFSFALGDRYAFEDVCSLVDRLRCFKIGFSWGGSTSLATPYLPPTWWPDRTAYAGIIRLGVGLESADDLEADLVQALESLD